MTTEPNNSVYYDMSGKRYESAHLHGYRSEEALEERFGLQDGISWLNMMVAFPDSQIAIYITDRLGFEILTDDNHPASLLNNFPGDLQPSIVTPTRQTLFYPNGSMVNFESRDPKPYLKPPVARYDGTWFAGMRNLGLYLNPEKTIQEVYTPIYLGHQSLGLTYIT